jgi:hypothetical protein
MEMKREYHKSLHWIGFMNCFKSHPRLVQVAGWKV